MCEVCFSTFSRKGDLKRHTHLHTGFKYDPYVLAGEVPTNVISVRPHKCPDCGKRFTQSSALKTHSNVQYVVRSICAISTHSRISNSTGEKPYACEIGDCEAVFSDPSSRTRHRKEKHRVIGGYQCPILGCSSR